MTPRFPNESAAYRAARDDLLRAEIDLRCVTEDVAFQRRALPQGGIMTKTYVFDGLLSDGSIAKIRLSKLFGEEPGWRNHRLLSSASNTFNRDYFGEPASGGQQPMLNVFERDGDKTRHFWGIELVYAAMEPVQEMRHTGTIEPLWNLFDMTRGGRGNHWDEQLQYPCCRPPASIT